jgi:hypothetical protein
MHADIDNIKFTDADVVNIDDAPWSTGCGNNRPWLMHDHGFPVAVVFAETFQDALDVAADKSKLDAFKVGEADLANYEPDGEGLDYLGNKSEPYDLESLEWVRLENVPLSFVALFNASKQER